MTTYDEELQRYQNELAEVGQKILARKQVLARSAHIPEEEKEIATALHHKLCHWNHTDGCGWLYDDGSWTEYSRQDYLAKARKILLNFSVEQARKFIELL